MWDFLSKNCGIFSSKGGTKIWDFRQQGGDFRRSGFGHTVSIIRSSSKEEGKGINRSNGEINFLFFKFSVKTRGFKEIARDISP